ncbi:MAG: hypothetical protein HRT43_05910, partial [Campylobacteraceae bacterium]|nr:hypothetical protein [Campylobacteraceae bacterium]
MKNSAHQGIQFNIQKILFGTFFILLLANFSFAAQTLIIAKDNIFSHTVKLGMPYVQCAMEKIKQLYKFESVPWKRAQFGTKNGNYDAFVMGAQNDKRDSYAVFIKTPVLIKWMYVVPKSSPLSPSSRDFKSNIFGSLAGSAMYNWASSEHPNLKAIYEIKKLILMLKHNRIHVALLSNFQMKDLYLKMDDYKT